MIEKLVWGWEQVPDQEAEWVCRSAMDSVREPVSASLSVSATPEICKALIRALRSRKNAMTIPKHQRKLEPPALLQKLDS